MYLENVKSLQSRPNLRASLHNISQEVKVSHKSMEATGSIMTKTILQMVFCKKNKVTIVIVHTALL